MARYLGRLQIRLWELSYEKPASKLMASENIKNMELYIFTLLISWIQWQFSKNCVQPILTIILQSPKFVLIFLPAMMRVATVLLTNFWLMSINQTHVPDYILPQACRLHFEKTVLSCKCMCNFVIWKHIFVLAIRYNFSQLRFYSAQFFSQINVKENHFKS